MDKKKKTVWIIVLIVCALIIVVGATLLIRSQLASETVRREDVTPATADEATVPSEETTAQAPTEKPLIERSFGYKLADPGDLNVDFAELKSINTDIYAWIYIPNTNVDYPVLRGAADKDDFFYLDHNMYRQYQFAGSVYSELKNNPDMHDPVTVLYGHNMRDGSMFAALHQFSKADFFDDNTTAFVLTEDKIFTYLIYAAYTFDNRHILNSYDFNNAESFQDYLDSTLKPRSFDYNVRENVELTTENRILTLSTCTESSGTRFLVQGVLVDEHER